MEIYHLKVYYIIVYDACSALFPDVVTPPLRYDVVIRKMLDPHVRTMRMSQGRDDHWFHLRFDRSRQNDAVEEHNAPKHAVDRVVLSTVNVNQQTWRMTTHN